MRTPEADDPRTGGDCRRVNTLMRGGLYRAEDELEHEATQRFIFLSAKEETNVKVRTTALAMTFALSSTFALAQNGATGAQRRRG
jgi:hypothetical protein